MGVPLLHRLPRDEVGTERVSDNSTWSDRVWLFDNPTAGAAEAMADWGRTLADGSTLFDAEWTPVLHTCKCLLWSLVSEPMAGKPLKTGTLGGWIYALWFIIDWMSEAGYRHLDELDAAAIDEYLEHLVSEKLSDEGDDASGHRVVRYLMPFIHMWQQTDALLAAGAETLPGIPFHGKAATAVAEELRAFTWREIPPVADSTYIATVNHLEAWIGYRGGDIARLMDIVLDLKELRGPNLWNGKYTPDGTVLHPALAAFRFSDDPVTGLPWYPALTDLAGSASIIRRLIYDLNMAGILAVQSMTGMRISEVCGLDALPGHPGPLPSCIEVNPSTSGLYDIFFITGKLYKTATSWIDARWVAGLRPRGTDHLPLAVQAVMLVERLFRRWRAEGGHESLFLTMKSGNGLPTGAGGVKRQRSTPLKQNEWIVRNVGIVPERKVTSHQWRKAFAKYLFRTDRRMLPSIALQLQHVSLAMAEMYVGGDLDLVDDIESEASHHAAELLFEWVNGGKPARGPVATLIAERCKALGYRLGNHSFDEKRKEIRRIVVENSITIWPLRKGPKHYGMCVLRPGSALCQATRIGPLFRPGLDAATAGLCSKCSNLAVDDEHVQFWIDRLEENLTTFEENRDDNIGVAMLATKRIDQCKRVLSWFGPQPAEADCG